MAFLIKGVNYKNFEVAFMTTNVLGERLVVIGAGIGGCFAAGALSKYFSETIILDRDFIPDTPTRRPGVPQADHIHGLLRRPLDFACELFPGIEQELVEAGGISLVAGSDARYHDNGSWQPVRDLGLSVAAQTRPLLEHVIRQRTLKLEGITLKDRHSFVDYIIENGVTTGVKVRNIEGFDSTISADLVVDSSGRAGPITKLLKQHGYDGLETTEIGVDISYTSAYFSRKTPEGETPSGYIVRSVAPRVRSGVIWPVEDDRWIVSFSGRFGDFPEASDEEFLEYAKTLEDPAIYDIIKNEERVSDFSRFMIPRTYWRRYDQMSSFPDRLIPIGDTVNGVNPVYGQGMALAAAHAEAIYRHISDISDSDATLDGISNAMRPKIAEVTSSVWSLTDIIDLSFEKTTGDRPEDLEGRLQLSRWVRETIVDHPELHKTMARISNMLEPSSAMADTLQELGLLGGEVTQEKQGA